MKVQHLFYLLLSCALYASCSSPCRVVWTEGPTDPESGTALHTMQILNPPAGTDWTIWFGQFRTPVTMQEGAPAAIEHVSGTLYRVIPGTDTDGKTMSLSYSARPLVNQCRAPEGFYLQKKGEKPVPLKVSYSFLPAEKARTFEWHHVATGVFDIIPRLKQVEVREGTTNIQYLAVNDTKYDPQQVPGWYRITLDGAIHVEAADREGAIHAVATLNKLRQNTEDFNVPDCVITDWPDLAYRGLMLDISRNFTRKDDMLRLIDILVEYKVDRLHLHFGDDEGWRIEIDGLPELTSYGAFRGIPELQEDGSIKEPYALQPTYCGSLDRDDAASPANGYYSHADFVEILEHAWDRGIRVIPEFDTPGHSRAAVKSMEVRAARTGDRTFLLSEPEDKSEYVSVQDYTDNVINVALPSTYAFIGKVFDSLIAMYKEAGAPLEAIHIGGDEVPEGAWTGSPACLALLEANGKADTSWLIDYYINRVLDIAEERGVKIAGWQDICQGLEPATLERLKRNLAFANLWTVSHGQDELAYQFANQGIPVVISNAPNCYLDFAYDYGKEERGHSWGGFVDERRTFSLLPYDTYRSVRWDDYGRMADISQADAGKTPLLPEARGNIIGVQGQLWAETLRSFDHVTYYIFPKALGLFERGWNASPAWEKTTVSDDPAFTEDFDRFFSIITDREYPYYESLGISYHRH